MGAVSEVAGRQYGLVSSDDLAELGVSRAAQSRWAARKYLRRQHKGVYAIGDGRLSVRGHWLAAILSFPAERFCPIAPLPTFGVSAYRAFPLNSLWAAV